MRLGFVVALLSCAALSGCNVPSQRDQMADIAGDAAADAVADDPTIATLKSKVDELESEIDTLKSESSEKDQLLREQGATLEAARKDIKTIIDHYNDHLRRYHGGY